VVEHRVSEHEVEASGSERERLGVGAKALDGQPETLGVRGQRPHHPRRDVGARGIVDDPGSEQVEAEIAGAGADLERAREPPIERGAEQLAQLADHLALADLPEVDPPFRVVARRGHVVIARVDVADLIRASLSVGSHRLGSHRVASQRLHRGATLP
jgi:hypothetical protein